MAIGPDCVGILDLLVIHLGGLRRAGLLVQLCLLALERVGPGLQGVGVLDLLVTGGYTFDNQLQREASNEALASGEVQSTLRATREKVSAHHGRRSVC